ncbi:unnamed protein product [Cuscuta campestris]|uniref:Uncharacterized protein n=1 Tax=Cuscuta campestris TaxID=132261 RepID=A0A484M5J6_9ASTE|nr:unnamed protein product [Cuscuta campestris]
MVGILSSAALLTQRKITPSLVAAGGIEFKGASKRKGSPARIAPNPATNFTGQPVTAALLAASVVIFGGFAIAAELKETETDMLPQTLSGEYARRDRIQRPRSAQAEGCTLKCVGTCIRGGYGSPGEGPLNVRRPLVVFKEGFRSRHYCLVECSDICNLISRDGEDDGP